MVRDHGMLEAVKSIIQKFETEFKKNTCINLVRIELDSSMYCSPRSLFSYKKMDCSSDAPTK